MRTLHKNKHAGFTLIELVIAMAIIAIIAAIAIPSYQNYQRKGQRINAITALTKAAQLQERWKSVNGSYTNNISNIGGNVAPPGSVTPSRKYTLALSNVTAETYTITATAVDTQAADTQCAYMTIDHVNRKTAQDVSSADTSRQCWPR